MFSDPQLIANISGGGGAVVSSENNTCGRSLYAITLTAPRSIPDRIISMADKSKAIANVIKTRIEPLVAADPNLQFKFGITTQFSNRMSNTTYADYMPYSIENKLLEFSAKECTRRDIMVTCLWNYNFHLLSQASLSVVFKGSGKWYHFSDITWQLQASERANN